MNAYGFIITIYFFKKANLRMLNNLFTLSWTMNQLAMPLEQKLLALP